jgi:hypothetical protein
MKVNWELYLNKQDGETLENTPLNRLRKRRHDQLGGAATTKTEKKALLQKEADRIKNAANGQAMDAALFELITTLTKEVRGNLTDQEIGCFGTGQAKQDYHSAVHFLTVGGEMILRSLNYKKTLPPDSDSEEGIPFVEQKYFDFDLDYFVEVFIYEGHNTHLSKSFVDFQIKVLEAVLASGFLDTKLIHDELEARRAGKDTYVPPTTYHVDITPVPQIDTKGIITSLEDAVAGIDYRERPPSLAQQTIKYFTETGQWKRNEDAEEIT